MTRKQYLRSFAIRRNRIERNNRRVRAAKIRHTAQMEKYIASLRG
jgi:hypothetical protein